MIKVEGKEIEVHVKGGFSERKGIRKFSDLVQINSLNQRTRNKIYDTIIQLFDIGSVLRDKLIVFIYTEILSQSITDIPKIRLSNNISTQKVCEFIKNIIINSEYYVVFDFIEGIIKFEEYGNVRIKTDFINKIDKIFIEENVNYRIVKNIIVDIVDDEQISSIDETLNNPNKVVATHYAKAIELLYKTKDYDNSIKESISSVEAICQILTNNDKATLGDALKLLKDKIHPAMRSAFEKLYGYTSDANGIRHSNGLGEGNSTFEEAKYMLISCAAFANYLKENII